MARPTDQALAVPTTPAEAVDGPAGFDPSRRFSALATADDLDNADEVALTESPLGHLALCKEAATWLRDLSDVQSKLYGALNKCRAIIKFHVRDSGVCCTLSRSGAPFSALEAFQEAVEALNAAIAMEAQRGATPKSDATAEGGDSAGPKDIAHD